MKEAVINLYTIDELTPTAQKRAYDEVETFVSSTQQNANKISSVKNLEIKSALFYYDGKWANTGGSIDRIELHGELYQIN